MLRTDLFGKPSSNTNIPNLDMVVGNGAECVSGSAPFLCHLVHVSRPSIAFQGLILFAGTPGIRIGSGTNKVRNSGLGPDPDLSAKSGPE